MEIEDLKKELMGVKGEIPQGIMWGTEINFHMLTMIGYKRLTNLEFLIKEVLTNDIPGDIIETGVWRGGACIFMRILLNEHRSNKKIIVADSFEGLPPPEEKYPHDNGDTHSQVPMLSVSLEQVTANFEKYTSLENVEFVKGWFKDTLPLIKNKFCIIRLDGDMYSSTIEALTNLYPLLQENGYCIIDDYGIVHGCQHAVSDYRKENNITSPIIDIDGSGVYWKKNITPCQ